jgi:choline kinase
MKAVILAAGRGSRLGALTEGVPKCMVSLAGQPLIAWQIAALRRAGVTQIVIVGGYRAEVIAPYADTMLRNDRWAETNMVVSLTAADELLSLSEALVCYSDIVYHPDHIARLAGSTAPVAITYDTDWLSLWRERFADPASDAENFECRGTELIEIGGRARNVATTKGQYMGLLKIAPTGWSWINELLGTMTPPEIAKLDMTSLLSRLLAAGRPIAAVPVAGRWCEVDNGSDLDIYHRKLAAAGSQLGAWTHDWRWPQEIA